MATVYRVRHVELGTQHALKLLMHKADGLTKRMLQEGKMQARLRHPNVVCVTDVVRHDGFVGLVMDYVDGVALGAFAYNFRLKGDKLNQLAHDVFDGVEAAHRLGLVHRDLKPDNILMAFESDGVVAKIADFGLAKALSDELRVARATTQGQMMGTPRYMAPEQFFDASSVDRRADLYALGAILYEVLGRDPLFPDSDLANALTACVTGDWKPLQSMPPGAPESWRETVHACLATKPEDRPASIAEVRQMWGPRPSDRPRWSSEDHSFLRQVQRVMTERVSSKGSATDEVEPAKAQARAARRKAGQGSPAPTPATAVPRGGRTSAPASPRRRRLWLGVAGLAIALTIAWVAVAGASLAWVSLNP
jgi:serine/threonine-protein kinase